MSEWSTLFPVEVFTNLIKEGLRGTRGTLHPSRHDCVRLVLMCTVVTRPLLSAGAGGDPDLPPHLPFSFRVTR